MEDYPKNLSEFEARFSSEQACRDYLCQLRWPSGFHCPGCGHQKAWSLRDGVFQCAHCDQQVSVIAGTIFHGTHKPLTLWFRMIWWVVSQKNGASALGLKHVLGLGSYRTAWSWLHKLRRAMVSPGRDRLHGIVEVDETYVGGQKAGKRGRGAAGKALVVIAAEIDGPRIGRIRLRRVADASGESLEEAVAAAVSPGSVIHTDGWRGYNGLRRLGYAHEVIGHEEGSVGEDLLPHCHRVASLMKRWLMGTHQGAVSHEHLEYYLDEYTFRFNRRTSRHRGKLFYRLLQNAMAVEPVTFKQLVKHVRGQKLRKRNI
jgi:transposase-like protein